LVVLNVSPGGRPVAAAHVYGVLPPDAVALIAVIAVPLTLVRSGDGVIAGVVTCSCPAGVVMLTGTRVELDAPALSVTVRVTRYRDEAFTHYSMVDPPVHVIVNNGHVQLVGFVRSQIELIKAESIARSVFGVLAVENRVQLTGRAQGH